ncbi:hypothetical protein [Celeribacter neptunius]|uniref:Uncharacterized protein n=1 Tax=Celeribacter neptunius TaxID=588602 RepID=A0A1I3W151_9RHOB|nr:hypothetical protein [Celeribacter neptunius]SFK00923.1 hypothetical protein SAMN04487991_3509 [Celeribacter neptunius]
MIELLFVACLSTSPDACEERSLLFTDITPMTCMMGAQPELAKWTEQHPAYTVSRWSCHMLRQGEQKT